MLALAVIIARRIALPHKFVPILGMLCVVANLASAQSTYNPLPAGTPLLHDDVPPGVIGNIQLKRQPNLCGYFQPVEFRGPKGSSFALAASGTFIENQPQPMRAALLVGAVYRFRMVGFANQPEAELFPTLEVIDRTYPPAERAHRFPIPIEIDETDIESALRGDLVTRVIYLEDGTNAEPVSYAGGPQRVYEVTGNDDTLRTADTFGRPLAILRIGSRVPDTIEGPEAEAFLYGSPPWQPIKNVPQGKTLSDIAYPQ